jgi:hypothetical protein
MNCLCAALLGNNLPIVQFLSTFANVLSPLISIHDIDNGTSPKANLLLLYGYYRHS